MSNETIIRAWKDENFRNNLSAKELTLLPANPVGLIELTDAELSAVAGALPPPTKSGCGTYCAVC